MRPPQHLLRMAQGDPCSSSPGRKPSKGYQGYHGSKCPKGQVKAPGDDEAPRLQSPCPLCCQTVQLLVRTPFRPSALVILDPHPAPCSRVSSSSRNRAPPSSTADFTPIPPGTCAPAPPSPTFPGLCGPQQGAHYCSTLGTSFAHPDTHSTLTGPTGKKCFSKAPSAVVTGVADSGSPPPSASWGAPLANAEAGSRCILTPGTNGSSWAPELSHGSDGAPVLAGGPRQGTDALMCDDRLLKGGVEDAAPATGPQGQDPSEGLPSTHAHSPGARLKRPESRRSGELAGPRGRRCMCVCVCVGRRAAHGLTRPCGSYGIHSRGPTGLCAPTRVLRGLSPWDPPMSTRSARHPDTSTRRQPRRARRGT